MIKKIPALALLLLLAAGLLQAQRPDTMQLTQRQPVLNGRGFLSLPATARLEARSADIMSADYNGNEETRFVMDIGKMRLVLFATELYLKADDNFRTEMETSNSANGFKTKILVDKDSLTALLSSPTAFDKTKQAILVNNLSVRTADNTLFRVDAYINGDALEQKEAFQALTEKIFASLTKGDRRNNLQERTEVLPTLNKNVKLSFRVPAGYCISIDKKYDFLVYKFHRFKTFAEGNNVEELILYTGFHPSSVYRELGLSEADATKVKGRLLGQELEWWDFEVKAQGLIDREQKVALDAVQKGMILHVAMISNERKAIDNLTKIVADISIMQ